MSNKNKIWLHGIRIEWRTKNQRWLGSIMFSVITLTKQTHDNCFERKTEDLLGKFYETWEQKHWQWFIMDPEI